MHPDKKTAFIAFSIIFLSIISTASADGGAFIYHPPTPDDDSYWGILDEESQTAFINYENNYENMILSIKTAEMEGERIVWLFPVPSTPDNVSIDILKTFPDFDGYNFKDEAEEKIDDTIETMTYTQIYPGIYAMTMRSLGAVQSDASASFDGEMYGSTLEIHEHIESMGLTSELITAKDSESIKQYMEFNNLDLPNEATSIIEEYIGKDYSFVMTWINDIGEFRYYSRQINPSAQYDYDYYEYEYMILHGMHPEDIESTDTETYSLGVSITFPTEKIYFPLRLTSIYGSRIIPIDIYVTGFVTPEYYGPLESTSKSEYYIDKSYSVPDNLKRFFNNKEQIKDLKYTKISISEASKFFTDDLWIKDSAPLKVSTQDFFYSHTSAWGIIVFLILTTLAGAITGRIIYKKSTTTTKEFALLGLSNIFTIIGLAIMTRMKTIEDPTSTPTPDNRTSKQIMRSSAIYALMLTILLVTSFYIFAELGYFPMYMLMVLIGLPLILEMIILSLLSSLSFLFHIWDLNMISRIILLYAGYFIATYPFVRYNIHKSKKIRFIALFSIIFLILTMIAGTLLKTLI